MARQEAAWGGRHGATRPAAFGKFELLDRDSVLVDEDGNRDDLDPELTAAIKDAFELHTVQAFNEFLGEVLADIGIASMEDLGGESLSSVLEGILD